MNTVTEAKSDVSAGSSQKVSLRDLREPVKKELDEFRVFFRSELKTNVFLLDQIIRYLMKMKGKELRPILVLYAAKLCGDINERTFRAATMIELLHTATLIHDDVVDDAEQRRGMFSINQVWKNKASVLLGDYLLAKGLLVSLDADEFQLLKIMSVAVKAMSEGELRQLKAAKLLNMTEEKYFEIIRDKTASLLAACCESGARSVTDDPETLRRMHDIGLNMGIAFQIRDDVFDYGPADVGKPIGNDIRERKITLPFIYTLGKLSVFERRKWKKKFRNKNKTAAEVDEIIDFVRESGGLDYATVQMEKYSHRALELLSEFPESPERTQMEVLSRYITTRKK